MGCLSLFARVYHKNLLSKDAFGLLSETFCHDLKSYALIKGLGLIFGKSHL